MASCSPPRPLTDPGPQLSAGGTAGKAADLEKRPFHTARRTAITNMAAAGVPLEVAASIVGHAPIRMTAEVY
ncbi:MAG TPA: tyrosine-type recombinase/integrase [Microthrixaceae bacterium]|nr:tyrosine-type recombinase/integrase [Microthrixaceae bacterium]